MSANVTPCIWPFCFVVFTMLCIHGSYVLTTEELVCVNKYVIIDLCLYEDAQISQCLYH